jgi:hypothetical protein
MIKTCLWTLLITSLFAATTWYSLGEITPVAWADAVGICTSNGDLAWSAAVLAIALVLLLIGNLPRKLTRSEQAATMRHRGLPHVHGQPRPCTHVGRT